MHTENSVVVVGGRGVGMDVGKGEGMGEVCSNVNINILQ